MNRPFGRVSRGWAPISLAMAAALAVVLAACSGSASAPSLSPVSPSTATASSTPQATVPTTPPSPSGTADPGNSAATAAPSATPLPSTAASAATCVVGPQAVELPSDRFISVVITPRPDADLVTFRFGNPSLPTEGEPPDGALDSAVPPFTQASSGRPIELTGEHALEIRFRNMSIQNDVGQPVYDGPTEYQPDLPALRHLVLFDMSEGMVGWYVGFDGTGCVSMVATGDAVTLTIGHS